MFVTALSLLLAAAPSELERVPTTNTEIVHIVTWDGNALPKPVQRSDQLPLTDAELVKLTKAGFDAPDLVKLVEERRCACDVSADGLIKLKGQGVHKTVLAAASLHGLQPNRALTLALTLDFAGEGRAARAGFFYVFLDDGDQTRVYRAPVGELLGRRFAHELQVDRSDLLLARSVRRIQLASALPLKTYGQHAVMVVFSANPSLLHPSQLSAAEQKQAQRYTFDYPRASLQSVCRLAAGFKRDALLADKWHFQGSQFACEWD